MTSGRRKTLSKKPKKEPSKKTTLHLEDFEGVGKEHDPSEFLTDDRNLGKAIIECLENNDPEGVMEVIAIYLEAVNKSKLSQKGKIHRQTIYSALKHRNPTIKTLSKIVHEFTH